MNPYIDAADLTATNGGSYRSTDGSMRTDYQWRDTSIIVAIDDDTGEIVNIYDEST